MAEALDHVPPAFRSGNACGTLRHYDAWAVADVQERCDMVLSDSPILCRTAEHVSSNMLWWTTNSDAFRAVA